MKLRLKAGEHIAAIAGSRLLSAIIVACGCIAISITTGCSQRKLAPELEYSDDNVQEIRDEIERMDWE